MKEKLTNSFAKMIKKHYGCSEKDAQSNTERIEELFARYYGKPPRRGRRTVKQSLVLSLNSDDGEILLQRLPEIGFEEYVVERSMSEDGFEEYIVYESDLSDQNSLAMTDYAVTEDADVLQESRIDILRPLDDAALQGRGISAQAPEPEKAFMRNIPGKQFGGVQSMSSAEAMNPAEATEDDFTADIKAILSGQKTYDPVTKKTIEKDKAAGLKSEGGSEPPVPDAKNGQAIFDKIAKSMQYANAYDLGTVELEKRFSDFDRIAEIQQRAEMKKPIAPPAGQESASAAVVDSEDFIRDMDQIRRANPSAAPLDAAKDRGTGRCESGRGTAPDEKMDQCRPPDSA